VPQPEREAASHPEALLHGEEVARVSAYVRYCPSSFCQNGARRHKAKQYSDNFVQSPVPSRSDALKACFHI
jgi:hypothetical protein